MTLCMEMPSPCVQRIRNHVKFGKAKTGPICSASLGRCSGWHSARHKQKGLAKELVSVNTLLFLGQLHGKAEALHLRADTQQKAA